MRFASAIPIANCLSCAIESSQHCSWRWYPTVARHTLSDTVGRAKAICLLQLSPVQPCSCHEAVRSMWWPRGWGPLLDGQSIWESKTVEFRMQAYQPALQDRNSAENSLWCGAICRTAVSWRSVDCTRRDTLRQDFFVEETECDILDSRPFDVLPAVSNRSERVALQHDIHSCMKLKCWQRWWWMRLMELPTNAAWSMHVCALEAKNLQKNWEIPFITSGVISQHYRIGKPHQLSEVVNVRFPSWSQVAWVVRPGSGWVVGVVSIDSTKKPCQRRIQRCSAKMILHEYMVSCWASRF